uniref:RlpA-like protein double-psi beta-barrel domain-containing protein n=1 Tax=Cyanoptyche gloeocystis TaxID=77922 RepID=A0A7S2JK41_9EUKA|mmetsp:Transcript_1305/g.2484  ORF Transcript_1305/g.2484 Transcript_1305/m.2484 type:complete len:164 (+) Transcript_1305:85-576(+)
MGKDLLVGNASYYANKFQGRRTACGDKFDQNSMTAAHRFLPCGTLVKVTNTSNNQSVVVRVNDRGPFCGGRVIDLSRAAAASINMLALGVAPVKLEIFGRSTGVFDNPGAPKFDHSSSSSPILIASSQSTSSPENRGFLSAWSRAVSLKDRGGTAPVRRFESA